GPRRHRRAGRAGRDQLRGHLPGGRMTRTASICPLCGDPMVRPDAHAPGLEENFPEGSIDVCPRCHNGPGGLTFSGYSTGMLKDHNRRNLRDYAGTQQERMWFLLQGLGDLLAAWYRGLVVTYGIGGMEEYMAGTERIG